jgi:predicted DNA binding protein
VSTFAEFDIPASAFPLEETLAALPDAIVEIERVVASKELLTPYFWVSNVSDENFEEAAETDPSIRELRRLDSFEEDTLYRAEWTENIESIVYAYLGIGAVMLDATGQQDVWDVQLRFDDHEQLSEFQSYFADSGITVELNRIHRVTHSHTGQQYGLTEKQSEALVTAWKAGYFESPAETTLAEVAADLGISQQALSQRLQNGYESLIANTLLTEPPPSA